MTSTPRRRNSVGLIHKIVACYLTLHRQAIKFPKPDRFTLGTKLENLMLDLIELVLLAKSKTGFSQMLLLNKTDLKLQTIKLIVRVAYEAKALSTNAYAETEEKLIEIGCLIGGWLKQTKTEKL